MASRRSGKSTKAIPNITSTQQQGSAIVKSNFDQSERIKLAQQQQASQARLARDRSTRASQQANAQQRQADQARRLAEQIKQSQQREAQKEILKRQVEARQISRPIVNTTSISSFAKEFTTPPKRSTSGRRSSQFGQTVQAGSGKTLGEVRIATRRDIKTPQPQSTLAIRQFLTKDRVAFQKKEPEVLAHDKHITRSGLPFSIIPSIPTASAEEFPTQRQSREFVSGNQNIPKPPELGGRFVTFNPRPEIVVERFKEDVVVSRHPDGSVASFHPKGSPKSVIPAQIVDEFEFSGSEAPQEPQAPRTGFTGIIPAIRQGEFETEFGKSQKAKGILETDLENVNVARQGEDFLEGFASPFVETGIAISDAGRFIASDDRDNFKGTEIETPSFVTDLFGVAIAQGTQAFGGDVADPSQTFEAFGERQTDKSFGRIFGETAGEIVLTVGTLGIGKAVQLGAKGATVGIKSSVALAKVKLPTTIIKFTKLPKVKVPKAKSVLQKQVNAHNKQIDEAQKLLDKAQKLEAKAGAKVTQKQADEIRRLRIKAETSQGKLLAEQHTRFAGLVKFGGKGLKVIDEREVIRFTGNAFTKNQINLGVGLVKKGGKGKGTGTTGIPKKPDEFFGGGTRTVKSGKVTTAKDIFKRSGLKTDEELTKIAKQSGGGVSGKGQQLIVKTKPPKVKVKTKVQTTKQAQRQKSALDNIFAVKPKTAPRVIGRLKVKPKLKGKVRQVNIFRPVPFQIVKPILQPPRVKVRPKIKPPIVIVRPPRTRTVPILRPPHTKTVPVLRPPTTKQTPDLIFTPPTRPPPRTRIPPPVLVPRLGQDNRLRRILASKPKKKSKVGKRLFDVADTPFGKVEVGLGFFIEQRGDESIAEAIGTAPLKKKKKKDLPIDNVFDPSGLFQF